MADISGSQDLNKMKVPELKKMLKDRGLATSGNKAELIDRLQKVEDLGEALPEEETEDILNDEADEPLDEGTEEDLLTEKENSNNTENIENQIADTKVTEEPKIVKLGAKTESQKLTARAERFGTISDESKKQSRADRFGVQSKTDAKQPAKSTPLSDVSSLDTEKLKKRAERFGSNVSSSMTQVESLDKLKKRAERFGQVTSEQLTKVEGGEKLLKRKERFGATTTESAASGGEEQAKKKSRAERFGLEK